MAQRRPFTARLLAFVLGLALPWGAVHSSVAEDTVKAAFLYRFASFVQWPAGVFANAESPIRLCVVGSDVFASVLERMDNRPKVDGRDFQVLSLVDSSHTAGCHIVYATGAFVEQTLRSVSDKPVLTVTDSVSDSTRGMIHFVVVQDRVRFHIDDAKAAESGLFISSRLLSLAVSVRKRAGK